MSVLCICGREINPPGCHCGATCLCSAPVNPMLVPFSFGQPVISARPWASAVAPRADGGSNWIACLYNKGQANPVEWVVMNLETGEQHTYHDDPYTPGTNGRYANSQYQIKHQIRAANGRIFWGAAGGFWWWYDPADEKVHSGGRLPGGTSDATVYSTVFNTTGSKLYMGTQAAGAVMPRVVEIDPVTLAVRALCNVGSEDHAANAFAYYLWAVGDWLYVLVGEDIWDIVAVHIPTKTQTVLYIKLSPAPWMFFVQKPEGLSVEVYTNRNQANQTLEKFWLHDGMLSPLVDGQAPLFPPQDVTKYVNPLVGAPLIDESQCPKAVRWRALSSDPWTSRPIQLQYATPIAIDQLVALPDGSILGNVEDYLGWFRGDLNGTEILGVGVAISGGPRLVVGSDVYLCGYPNATLWKLDLTQPWDPPTNPKKYTPGFTDSVTLSGVKRPLQLAYCANPKRLYMAGDRDRTGFGAGIGYYDFALKKFFGHHAGLESYTRRLGLVVLEDVQRVVFGGNAPALIVHDMNLVEQGRHDPGVGDSGRLFNAEPGIVVGINDTTAYRWSAWSYATLETVDLSQWGVVDIISQNAYGTITALVGESIIQIDPITLDVTLIGRVPDTAITSMAQVDCDLYAAIGAELVVFLGVLPT